MTKKESKILNEIFEEVKDDYIRETIEDGAATVETDSKYRLLARIQKEFEKAKQTVEILGEEA